MDLEKQVLSDEFKFKLESLSEDMLIDVLITGLSLKEVSGSRQEKISQIIEFQKEAMKPIIEYLGKNNINIKNTAELFGMIYANMHPYQIIL